MDRRKFLVGVGSASLGGSALLGSGAFSRVESHRNVTIQVAEDPDAYLGLKPLDTPNSQNYVELDENGHLRVDIGDGGLREGDGPAGEGVNSNSRTWFDGMFDICNQGKEDACIYWEFGDDFEMRDEAELVFYYDGDEDDDETTEGRVDVEAGREVPLELGECARMGIRTETFDVDATDDDPLFEGDIKLVADVGLDCFQERDPPDEPDCPEEETWDEIGDADEAGGPVIVMGLDSELGAGGTGHGPPEEHADMVDAMLDNVTNGQEGILVLGGSSTGNIPDYWEGDIGDILGVDVDFEHDVSGIESVDFENYAMVGVPSTDDQVTGGLLNDENEAIIDRSDDLAAFVNGGGGLLVKAQEGFDNPVGFLDPFGDFDGRFGIDGIGYGDCNGGCIEITQEGEDFGLDQPEDWPDEPNDWETWCCWHDVYTDWPEFLDVLAWNRDSGSAGEDDAAAIGGADVVVEREVSLEITGKNQIEVGEEECYDVEIENRGPDAIEGEFEIEVLSGSGTVTDDLPDSVSLEAGGESGDSDSWSQDLCLECDSEGTLEVDVKFVDIDDGFQYVEVTMDVECVDELAEEC